MNYSKFLKDVNIVFTVEGLDKDPLLKPPEFEKGHFIDPNDVLTPNEE